MENNLLKKIRKEEEKEALLRDGIIVRDNVIAANTFHPMHWHDYMELEIVISGSVEYIYNQSFYTARRGNAFLMSNYDIHSLKNHEEVCILNIRFTEKATDEELYRYIASGANRFACELDERETEHILSQTNKLKHELANKNSLRQVMIKNLMTDILLTVLRGSDCAVGEKPSDAIHRTVLELQKNFRDKITLVSVAREACFSPNYFGTLFKNQIGITFNEYLNALRLKYACTLLLNSEYSIKEIALNSGYSSVEYFLYVFKKQMKMTPKKYRENRRDDRANMINL